MIYPWTYTSWIFKNGRVSVWTRKSKKTHVVDKWSRCYFDGNKLYSCVWPSPNIYLLKCIVKIRKMKKTKNGHHKQPLNINISFNINPKHVLQSQHNANLKVDNNIYNSNSHSPNKSRTSQRQNAFSQFHSSR